VERLWSRAVATGGNRWQMGRRRKRLKQAKTVAVGCDRLRPVSDGKEGVDGSSPSEGFARFARVAIACLGRTKEGDAGGWNRVAMAVKKPKPGREGVMESHPHAGVLDLCRARSRAEDSSA